MSEKMSKETGKNLNPAEPQLTLKNHNPGCMWGILHHFQHNRWHHVVKRLPRKRIIDHGRTRSTCDAPAKVEDQNFEKVETAVPGSAHKSSMKSRIKALISEEMYRRKGRHKRSSSYPIRKHLPDQDKPPPTTTDQESSPKSCSPKGPPSVHSSDDPNSSSHGPSCELCDTMMKVNYLKQNEVDKLVKQPVRDHTVLHGNSIYAVEPSKGDAIQQSKLFMDALDLLNVREEVFLKILQDPTSSLAHQWQVRQSTPNLRFGLTKSVSFAAAEKRDYDSDNPTLKQEEGCCARDGEEQVEETGENGCPDKEDHDQLCSDSADQVRKKNENKVGINSFKNITAKLKHVIRDKKKEKNRIMKDAVHHKIPCDRSASKNDAQIGSDFGKTSMNSFKRTSSFSDSFDRYNQLLEISINKEAKGHVSDRLRFKTGDKQPPVQKSSAKLGRIHSLPDLRSYSSTQIDDSATNASLIAQETVVVREHKPLDSSEPQIICSISESGSQENLLDLGKGLDELVESKPSEGALSTDIILERVLSSTPLKLDEMSEDEIVHEIEVCFSIDPKLDPSILFPSEDDPSANIHDLPNSDPLMLSQTMETQESQIQQLYNDLMYIHHVDSKNEAEYNYVRDVLELSGFSRDALQRATWESAEHLLNPSVFEQVEECLVDQSECEPSSDHILLFDTINEVLLRIHERSFCYWPRPLTSLSRMHQLPKGRRVLEEVWSEISWLLMWRPELDQAIDEAVSRDMSKNDGWMNLQLDAECVGLKLEEMIFDDLIDEIMV